MSSNPIGIFDSGIGGLTVAHAVKETLPNESMIYFGDIAHLPYGDKSEAAIQAYSIKIANVLLNEGCKVILIACNSASSSAYELLKEYVASRAKVINVIDPMVEYVSKQYSSKKIGLIGTKRTVQSNVYAKKINDLGLDIHLESLATPLLVPMIEEGFIDNQISEQIITEYLGANELQDIEALILGCTHYPLIKSQISTHYDQPVEIIDSSEIVAASLKAYLTQNDLLNKGKADKSKFLVSDYTYAFEASTKLFFGEELHLEKYPLWE
ncbi:MAG: glutamate racemase [Bacteroidota bacterium]